MLETRGLQVTVTATGCSIEDTYSRNTFFFTGSDDFGRFTPNQWVEGFSRYLWVAGLAILGKGTGWVDVLHESLVH